MKKVISFLLLLLSVFSFAQNKIELDESLFEETQTAESYDARRKMRKAKRLTKRAIEHFKKVSIEDACNDFIYNPLWREEELFVFVFDETGNCLAHGDDSYLIWKNISKVKAHGDVTLLSEMLRAKSDGKVIGYLWDNSYKSSFIATTYKNGVKYILGAGFYPRESEYTLKTLIKSAVNYFYSHGADRTFEVITNPFGPFVKGDIFLIAVDFDGLCMAHGEDSVFVGQSLLNLKDNNGKFFIRDFIDVAKNQGKGWVEFIWHHMLRRAYIEKVIDPKTKKPYLIAGGYYPHSTFEALKNHVKKAVAFLKTQGSKEAFSEFNLWTLDTEFVLGGTGIMAFDLEGTVKASAEYPSFVGQNIINRRDQEGKFWIKEVIDKAEKYGKGIVSYNDWNSNLIMYFEKVDTEDGKFIVAGSYIPDSKDQAVKILVNKAMNYLNEKNKEVAFNAFSSRNRGFLEGDLHVFVYNTNGVRLVNGMQKGQIWQNFIKKSDQEGRQIVNDLIQTAINGGGWLEYKIRSGTRKIYVKLMTKENKLGQLEKFVVGSGYFL